MKLRALWPFLVIALVAFVPTWRFVFGGQVPAPVDQVHQMPPWNGKPSQNEWDILQVDGALQFLPWRHYMLDSMRQGFVPLWNPYTFGGTPFLANSQSAPLYPLHWLWPFDAESLLSFSAWLHLVVAGIGVFLLCKRLGSDDNGGMIAGTAVSLSAFMVGWLQLPSVQMTAAWIPWCLLGVFRLFDEPTPKSVAKLGIVIGLMLLAGHLQIAAFGILATGLAVLWLLAFERRSIKTLALCAAGLLIGFAVASPQILPSLENARNGHRASVASEEGWKAYQAQAIKPEMLVTAFDPTHFGQPQWGEGLTGYWLSLQEPGRNYAESAWFVGPIILPLALFSLLRLRRNARALFLGALCVLAILIALGTVVAKAVYFGLPGWSATGSPGRVAILFAVAACVLAGLAFRSDDSEKPPRWITISAVLVGVFGLLWAKFSMPTKPIEFYGVPSSNVALAAMLTIPALLALGALALAPVKYRGVCAGAMLACQLVLLSLVHIDLNPGSARGRYREPFPNMERLVGRTVAIVNDNWNLFGAAAGAAAPPNSLMPYGIVEVGGYDSIIPRRTKEQLDDVNGKDSAPVANGNMLFVKPGFDPTKLRALGVDYVIGGYNLNLPVESDMGNWRLYRLPGEKPKNPVLASNYNEKTLAWNDRREESTRWLESANADGWEMSLLSLDYVKGTVTATYRPHSYRLGFLLAMFGISAIFALLCWYRDEPTSSAERP